MEKIKLGLILIVLLAGCSVQPSTARPVIWPNVTAPNGWDNPVNGWCKRHQIDPDCR